MEYWAHTVHERWNPRSNGFSHRTVPKAKQSNAGQERTSLCLGSGLSWDPAEAARVAAAEARAERGGENEAAPESTRRSPARPRSASAGRQKGPRVSRKPDGWLSLEVRTNQPDRSTPHARPSDPPPLQGPRDPRVLARTFRTLDAEDDPSDDAGKTRKGSQGKSRSGWNWDADYEDKDPVDARAIMHKRINGGISSPARWDEKTMGFFGTDRMRHLPDSAGFRKTVVPDA